MPVRPLEASFISDVVCEILCIDSGRRIYMLAPNHTSLTIDCALASRLSAGESEIGNRKSDLPVCIHCIQ